MSVADIGIVPSLRVILLDRLLATEVTMNEPFLSFLNGTVITIAALVPTIIAVVELIQRFGS